MSASYDSITGLPTFYKYVPEVQTTASWELPDDLMTIIGKSVEYRRSMNSVIGQIQDRENDWYSKIYEDLDGLDGGNEFEMEFDAPTSPEDLFRFHAERISEGFWVYERNPPEGIAFWGVDAIKYPNQLTEEVQ